MALVSGYDVPWTPLISTSCKIASIVVTVTSPRSNVDKTDSEAWKVLLNSFLLKIVIVMMFPIMPVEKLILCFSDNVLET